MNPASRIAIPEIWSDQILATLAQREMQPAHPRRLLTNPDPDPHADVEEIHRAVDLLSAIKATDDDGRSPKASLPEGKGIANCRIVLPFSGARLFCTWEEGRIV